MIKRKVTISQVVNNNEYCPLPMDIFPNRMGINLCSVDSVEWEEQNDGQIKKIIINFIPNNEGEN